MRIAGDDKGLTGIVTKVIRSQNRVIVQGLNRVSVRCVIESVLVLRRSTPPNFLRQVTKHTKKQADKPGQKVHVEAPIHMSNVSLVELVPGTGVDGKEPE